MMLMIIMDSALYLGDQYGMLEIVLTISNKRFIFIKKNEALSQLSQTAIWHCEMTSVCLHV